MNKHMIRAIVAAVLLVLLGQRADLSCAPDTLFLYKNENVPFLRYLQCTNTLSGATVVYRLGELGLKNSTASRRISFADSAILSQEFVQNGSGAGVQSSLLPFLKSNSFTIGSTEDTLLFYREISVAAMDTLGNTTSNWRLDDKSEFVLRLIRKSNDSVLAIIDSVGLDSTATVSDTVSAYGVNVDVWCLKKYIPSPHRGIEVYLQLVPKRWGSTPYGMVATSSLLEFSQSAYRNCGYTVQDSAGAKHFRDRRWSEIMSYLNTVWESDCYLPSFPENGITSSQWDEFNSTFFDVDSIFSNGDVRYHVKECNQYKTSSPSSKRTKNFLGQVTLSGSLTASEVSFCINSMVAERAEIDMIEVGTGRVLLSISNDLLIGANCNSYRIPVASGAYFMRVYLPKSGFVFSEKMLLSK